MYGNIHGIITLHRPAATNALLNNFLTRLIESRTTHQLFVDVKEVQ